MGIFFIFLFSSTAFPNEATNINGTWKKPPPVYICKNSRIPTQRVYRAVVFWQRLGYSFSNIHEDREGKMCNNLIPYGAIVIEAYMENGNLERYAKTRIYKNTNTNEIKGARIEIRKNSYRKERILEHELGHALGLKHFDKKYHIMNPFWLYGGWDVTGVKK